MEHEEEGELEESVQRGREESEVGPLPSELAKDDDDNHGRSGPIEVVPPRSSTPPLLTALANGPSAADRRVSKIDPKQVYETREALRLHLDGYENIQTALNRLRASTSRLKQSDKHRKASTLTRRDANIAEVLSEQLEQALAAVASKDEDLKLAAEIGSTLLDKFDEARRVVLTLEDELSEAQSAQREVEEERERLAALNKRYCAEAEALADEHQHLAAEARRWQDSATEVTAKLSRALASGEARDEDAQASLKKLRADVAQLEARNRLLEEQVSALRVELNEAERREQVATEYAAAAAAAQALESGTAGEDESLSDEVERLRAALAEAAAAQEEARMKELRDAATIQQLTKEARDARAVALEQQRSLSAHVLDVGRRMSVLDIEMPVPSGPSAETDEADLHGPLPDYLTVSSYVNVVNCVGIMAAAAASLAGGYSSTFFDAIAVFLVSILWAVAALHPASAEERVQNLSGFYYTPGGRGLAIGLLGLFVLCLGLPGYIVGGLTLANALFNALVVVSVPEMGPRLLAASARSTDADGDREPTLEEPLLRAVSGEDWSAGRSGGGGGGASRKGSSTGPAGGGADHHRRVPSAGGDSDHGSSANDPGVWEKRVDQSTGRTYFYNVGTGQTSFSPQ